MTRWSLGSLLAASLVGPWGGCDREPVSPPAAPPSEQAPLDAVAEPQRGIGSGEIILLEDTRRRG